MDPLNNQFSKSSEESRNDIGDFKSGSIYSHITDPLSFNSEIRTVSEYAIAAQQAARHHLTTSNLESMESLLGNKKVTLVVSVQGGFGDILFTHKAALALKERGCEVAIAILPPRDRNASDVKDFLVKMTGMEEVKVVTYNDPERADLETDCVIIAPTIPKDNDVATYFPNFSDRPCEIIHEYGVNLSKINTTQESLYLPVSAGIGSGQLGIFTEGGLIKPLSSEEKALKLDSLLEEYPEKITHILDGKKAIEYLESTKLFFGYAHDHHNMEKFLSVVLSEQKPSSENIDIVIPWRLKDKQSDEFYQKCRYKKNELKAAGIGVVEVVTSEGVHRENITEDGSGKVLRIINVFPLPNALMKDLLEISDDLTLATGDQSWNEAILMPEKIILYERLNWKVEFCNSIIKKSKAQPLVENVLEGWNSSNAHGDIAQAIRQLRSDKLEGGDQLRQFHASIVNKENSFENHLYEEVIRLSSTKKSSEFKLENEIIELKIKELFYFPLLIEKCAGLLMKSLAIYVNSGFQNYTEEDVVVIKNFRSIYDETNKDALPAGVLPIMERAFLLYDRIEKKEEITREELYKVMPSLASVSRLLISVISERIKELE